jgi:N-acetylneuraminic acid mutarotase
MHRSIYLPFLCVIIMALFTRASCNKANLSWAQDGNWVQAASIGAYPRANSSSFVIGNKAYVGLGFNETIGGVAQGRLTDLWSFSLDSGWMQEADFPGQPRSNAAGFSLGSFGYIGTGWDGYHVFHDFYRYDPVLNQWIVRDSFPGGDRYDAVGFGLQGKGYIGTGFNNYWLNDFYQYDPQSDTWARTPGTSGNFSKRRGAVSFVYNNKAYIFTGSMSGGMARDGWAFDPSQPAPWTPLHNITNTDPGSFDDGYTDIEREYASAFVNGDHAYLALGRNGTMVTSTWVYDFVQDIWSRRTAYPRQPRYGAVAFTIGGKSFIGTGSTGNNATFDDFNQFVPDQPYNPND